MGTMDLRKEWLTNKKENGIKQKEKKYANCREGKGIIFLFFYFYIPFVTTAFLYRHKQNMGVSSLAFIYKSVKAT